MSIISFSSPSIMVVDQFLPSDDFTLLSNYMQNADFVPSLNRRGETIWKNDGYDPDEGPTVVIWPLLVTFSRRVRILSRFSLRALGRTVQCFPSNSPIDTVLTSVHGASDGFSNVIGKYATDWVGMTGQAFRYKAGTQSSWHTDGGIYSGAYILYTHPQWDAEWGGELLIGNDINGQPTGTFIAALPNRLVVIRGGTRHKVSTVSPRASPSHRMSVAGFFVMGKAVPQLLKTYRGLKRRGPVLGSER